MVQIDEHFIVDPLIVVHIQLPATEKVDVSDNWKSRGGRSWIRLLAREDEDGHYR